MKAIISKLLAVAMCAAIIIVSGCSIFQSKPSDEVKEQLARKSIDSAIVTALKRHPTPYGLLTVTKIINKEVVELHCSQIGEPTPKETENKVLKNMWPVKVKAVVKVDFFVDGLADTQTQKGDIHYTMYIYKDEFGEYRSMNGIIND